VDLQLAGKRAVVTGGSRGIGYAAADALAGEGASVVLVARHQAALDAAARRILRPGQRILAIIADTTDDAAVRAMIETTVAELGGVDILVNAAAQPARPDAARPLAELEDEDLRAEIETKVLGYLRTARAAVPYMIEQGWGRIINISGANARNAGNLSGGARNASLVHMTKTLAVQMGRHGITVNCIHPGTTRTERTPSLLAARAAQLGVSPEEAERQDFAPDSPRGNAICRMVDASEIAFVTVFLASDKAWAVSGELVAATGGAGRTVHY